ncbi:MAG: hypothetical protein RBR30_13660 [Tenuifilaceae bacterium]|jgi:hypothetical protein|nr:hypothetical protein [Sphaerochaeta sp.]MDY0255439.1 hypothetical protein [Tenuifilaceae bacterium]
MIDQSYFTCIQGAVYIPTQAWNAYQQWRDYRHDIIERDLGYAQKLKLNAIRVWMSYEYWVADRSDFEKKYEDLVTTAFLKGIRVMPSMFECCGREPRQEYIEDTGQFTATAVRSPGTVITEDREKWGGPFSFLDWFLDAYGNDHRILAIEVTNEPKTVSDHMFALELLKRAKGAGVEIPVTLGAQTLFDNILYKGNIDIFQTHENIHLSEFSLKGVLERAKMVEEIEHIPVWVTEWQQIRTSGIGFSGEYVDKGELRPNHKSMARWYHTYKVGNFVWSLMLKPAYLTGQRSVGTFSGLFHEDGCVYSLEDARAVANNPELVLEERRSLPICFNEVALKSE